MSHITYFLLNYKEEMQENEIITRLKILRMVFVNHIKQKDIAKKLQVHKNTINTLVRKFKQNKQS